MEVMDLEGARGSTSSSNGSVFEERNGNSSLTSLNIFERDDSKDDFNRAECIARRLKKKSMYSDALCRQAIACTGVSDYRNAAKWLVDHIDDPLYGTDSLLNVSILLVPSGNLTSIVEEFWEDVRKLYSGWRPSHNLPPRISLVKPFQIKCSKIIDLYTAFDNVFRYFSKHGVLDSIPLTFASKDNFFGFVIEPYSSTENILNDMVNQFNKACYELGIQIDVSRAVPYHMTLEYTHTEYAFSRILAQLIEQFRQSLTICQDGHLDYQETQWELRMYTSDPRVVQSVPSGREEDVEAYRMCTEWLDMNSDNDVNDMLDGHARLEFSIDDVVCLLGPAFRYKHGLAQGFNCNTGVTGLFPLACADRAPIWKAWTMHRSLNMMGSASSSPNALHSRVAPDNGVCVPYENGLASSHLLTGILPDAVDRVGKPRKNSSSCTTSERAGATAVRKISLGALFSWNEDHFVRQLHVMRHGERVDFALGHHWITQCFNREGLYKRCNLNMTSILPSRPFEEFAQDPPLTVIGHTVSAETGRALAAQGIQYSCCYCSPALRCVQTAAEVLRACGGSTSQIPIRIEPFLFEWLGWYKSHHPIFMGPDHLRQCGYNVDHTYRPHYSEREFDYTETDAQYYQRKHKITKRLLDASKKAGVGHILIVAHAGSLDACTRQLVKRDDSQSVGCAGVSLWQRSADSLSRSEAAVAAAAASSSANMNVPYCGLLAVEERRQGKWILVEPPVPNFTHGKNYEFNWRELAAV